jgi:hypothetical protein
LREELGLKIEHVGSPIWMKEHVFSMNGGWDGPVVKSLIATADDLSRQLGHVDARRTPEAVAAERPKTSRSARRVGRR